MKIDNELVLHLARLSRLKILDEEVAGYQEHLQSVLNYFEELKGLDLKDVKEFTNPIREVSEYYKDASLLRADQVSPSLDTKLVLKNAPETHLNQFRVDAVLEDS